MQVTFPYPGYEQITPFEVPDASLMGVFGPKALPDVDEERVLHGGFAQPWEAPRLRDAAQVGQRVLILIDDATRGTPVPALLRHVLGEFESAGLRDSAIEFLTAQGTHRRMTDDELRHKLGPYSGRFRVHQHDWRDAASLREFGHAKDGTRVTANKLLGEFDFVLGLGSIVPHRVKGTSGGAKIAFPGVSGPEMMYRNQWEASMLMSETVMGEPENSMRLRMEEAARLAGLRYIVNVVCDRTGKIVGCFCGDPVAAHRAGSKLTKEINTVHLPQRADIVIVDAHPADRDFWQSAKGIYSGTMAVREGGSLILVAPNPEGVADNHPILMQLGRRPHAELVKMVQHDEVEDLVGVAILADTCQIMDHADCIMLSPGVPRDAAERIGFRWAPEGATALRMAFERQGDTARVAVLQYGGHILPQAGPRSEPQTGMYATPARARPGKRQAAKTRHGARRSP